MYIKKGASVCTCIFLKKSFNQVTKDKIVIENSSKKWAREKKQQNKKGTQKAKLRGELGKQKIEKQWIFLDAHSNLSHAPNPNSICAS